MPRPKIETYESEYWILKIKGWARDGLSEEQIAYNMGISPMTLSRWKKRSEGIDQALKEAKDVADRKVENALFKSALGYSYEEVTEERKFNPKTQQYEMVVTKIVHKTVLPQTTAQIFWLKNRKQEEWRDRRQVEDYVSFENDGFIEALKKNAEETFKDSDKIVEE